MSVSEIESVEVAVVVASLLYDLDNVSVCVWVRVSSLLSEAEMDSVTVSVCVSEAVISNVVVSDKLIS